MNILKKTIIENAKKQLDAYFEARKIQMNEEQILLLQEKKEWEEEKTNLLLEEIKRRGWKVIINP